MAHGANVNAGEGGSPTLHGAVAFNQLEMVEWLLDRGAKVNALDNESKTPLSRAIEKGNDAIADLLRRRGGKE